jgi:GTP-binding protein
LRLLERPQVIAASKMDMPDAEKNLEEFRKKIDPKIPVFPISSLTQSGIKEMVGAVYELILTTPEFPMEEPIQDDGKAIYTFEKEETPFVISRDPDGTFNVSGPKVELLFKMTNFQHDEAIRRFALQLRSMGVDDALREKGVTEGDTVRIMDFEFEYSD